MNNYKKLKVILLLFVFCFSFLGNVFAYRELIIQDIDGKPVRVIKVILDGQDFVVTSLANDGGDTLENLVKKVGGDAGINGTFFCPADYSYCNGITHSNFERVYLGDGESYSASRPDTSIRAIFGFDIEGNPLMVQNRISEHDIGMTSNINKDKLNDIEFGLSNYTVLFMEGRDITDVNYLNFTSNMYSSANRNFICSTQDGKTIYMGVVGGISIPKLATYIKENFDCYNALALDAGASEAMVYDGNVLARSSRRKIMDAFVVVDRDTYIKLTGYTPSEDEPYIPDDQYELTTSDIEIINSMEDSLNKATGIEGNDFKYTEKKIIRELVSNPNISIQNKAILHELLIRLFTIDKI